MGWWRSGRTKSNDDFDIDEFPFEWRPNPEFTSGPLVGLLFGWIQPLFTRAAFLHKHGKALEQKDLAPLSEIDESKVIQDRFDTAFDSWKPQKNYPDKQKMVERRVLSALWQVFQGRLVTAGCIKVVNTGLQFSFPILLNAILRYFEETQRGDIPDDAPPMERYRGYWLSCLLLFFISCKAVTESAYFHRVNRCGFQVKAAVSTAVYSKCFRLTTLEQQSMTLGEMVNLMQVDATKMEAFVPQIHVLWDGILQIAGYMTILGFLLGWPCLIGLLVMFFAGPIMGKIMGKLFGMNRAMVKFSDERVKTVNEAFQGIRCVKMYTWEDSFGEEIGKFRIKELECLRTVAYLRGFARAYMSALPTVASVCTFLVYAFATDGEISASILFSAIATFDQLRFPLMFYPMALAQLAQGKVSLSRVSALLGMNEVASNGYSRDETCDSSGGEVSIEDATIYWSDPNTPISRAQADDSKSVSSQSTHDRTLAEESEQFYPKPILSNVSLHVRPGEMTAIIGRVGSGKSTLCSAILNDTILTDSSKISVRGKVAYVAQNAWILNKTLRENILFGQPYEEARYNQVIKACQLTHDLALLDDGDLTEIGERGINLSGGQKQRVSVARAAYSNADIIIMDDPMSALDPEVASKLFDECILGFMGGKTRILVTNQLQKCLPKCDSIVVLGRGRTMEQGNYESLINSGGEVQRLLKDLEETAQQKNDADEEPGDETAKKDEASGTQKAPGKAPEESAAKDRDPKDTKALTTKEEREVGGVKPEVYLKYLKAGGGYCRFGLVYFSFILCAAVGLMTSIWVTLWTSDTDYERNSQGFYVGMYALTAVLLGLFTFLRSYLLATFGVRASIKLHRDLLSSIFRAPMSFFDTTPTGRILARFSKDMHTIDQDLTDMLDFVLFMTLSITITLGTIVFTTPWFGIVLIPVVYFYVRVLNYFREVSRETKRLESLSSSPVYAHFSETLGGLSTIRAYGEVSGFINEFDAKVDVSTQAVYNNKTADRWLAVRLELIGALIAGLASIFATQIVLSDGATGSGNTSSFASLAGLSLTSAIVITGMLNWVVRMFAQVEASMNSCERVFYYSEQIPQEAPATRDEMESSRKNKDGGSDPASASAAALAAAGEPAEIPSDWPNKGAVVLKNLHMRYRQETPLVLKGLDVSIEGGERVGVVGRTGSGKSSLLLTLMRIVEPELQNTDKYEPPITIDGVDILRVGLNDLRSKFGIIPQNPVLFSGTVRSNLDPFNEYSDEQIWSALENCGMKDTILAMPDELSAPVAEYGENLSQGQRQLLCLGRALLRQCRLLLLDEATSSVDFETDRSIQQTIRQAFKSCTVLTIAHRVDTIMDSDKILVMDDGVAAEFGSPEELLANKASLFSEIVRHGEAQA